MSRCLLMYAYSPRVCVVFVCFLFYLSMYLCFARCVICVLLHIRNHLYFEYIYIYIYMYLHIAILFSMCNYVTVPIAVHIALPICLSYSSVCFLIRVRLVYVYSNSYTHISPSSCKFMFASKSTSISPSSCIYFHSGKNI